MKTYQTDREASLAEQEAAREEAVIQQFFRARPEYACIANAKLLREYFNGDEITFDALTEAVAYMENKLARVYLPTVEQENAHRRSLSVPELRELARRERPVPQPDELPLTYIPIGKKKEVELTADVLRRAGTRTGDLNVD
jgi:hypothetical protein